MFQLRISQIENSIIQTFGILSAHRGMDKKENHI